MSNMGSQGTGRKRSSNKDRSTAEDDALNLIAKEAEARLAAKRAARAEAREIRMRELERQQKEIFQVQKKYYGLNTKLDDRADGKWGDIEQWMEDSERYSRPSQMHTLSDDDERLSVGSRGSVRSDLDSVYGAGGSSLVSHKKSKKKKKHKHKDKDRNGYDDEYSVVSSRSSRLSDDSRVSRSSRGDLLASYASSDLYSLNGLSSTRNTGSTGAYQSALYEDSHCSGSQRVTGSGAHSLEYSSYHRSNSRTSSRANSARTSPVDNCGSVASYLRSSASSGGLLRDLDDVTIPDFSDADDKDYLEKGSRSASALTATTLTSLGGSSSRRGSVETAITVDAEAAVREIKEIHELKDQIQDVESKYTQNLKEAKDALTEVEEKYRKAMVSNAQLDNEKNNLMYQVDTLKDSLMELEELLSESRREYEEKVKEFEREKHAHSVLQFQLITMKETLKQSEELLNEIRQLRMKQDGFAREISDLQETVEWKDKKIGALERQKEYTDAIRIERDELREEVVKLKDILKKHGIVLGPDMSINGSAGETETEVGTSGDSVPQPAQESSTFPAEGNSMLEIRLRKLVDEREKMIEQIKNLKAQLGQKSQKNGIDGSSSSDGDIVENGNDPNTVDMQRDSSRQISDMKFKLVKAEQEVTALEQNVSRLEGQVTRYKSAAESAEKVEDDLKAEKRKLQRELRSALDKIDELESNNSHLTKRLEKIKSSRGMAQSP
uniref:leucine-rich repeat flightless-interacting protein 2 isoform X40 n=1 Tax=Doryrhamphus excisus TaxID=161450 RepID=UPI0025AE664E|nr:leucine-rich repeat flightless-interacting protein 2 isoform X40 [Doryrhamphus excisus]